MIISKMGIHTNIPIRSRPMQKTRPRTSLAFIFRIDSRLDDHCGRTAVLLTKVLDIGLQSIEVAGPGVIDEVVDRLE